MVVTQSSWSEEISIKQYEKTIPLLREMDSIGIKCSRVVLAQFIDETSVNYIPFKSKIFLENNNICGMKHNSRGYSLGVKNGHANYADVLNSLLDYKAWQTSMLSRVPYKVETDEDYLYFLEHLPVNSTCTGRYAENPRYVPQLRKHLTRLKRITEK